MDKGGGICCVIAFVGDRIDLWDRTNNYQSRVLVDNVDLTTANNTVAPEPASLFLLAAG